jgi:hypothetical protein
VGRSTFFFAVNSDDPKSCLDKNENDMLRIFCIKVISFTVLSTKVPYLKSTYFTFHIVFTVAVSPLCLQKYVHILCQKALYTTK